jgi:hypothetical protein
VLSGTRSNAGALTVAVRWERVYPTTLTVMRRPMAMPSSMLVDRPDRWPRERRSCGSRDCIFSVPFFALRLRHDNAFKEVLFLGLNLRCISCPLKPKGSPQAKTGAL